MARVRAHWQPGHTFYSASPYERLDHLLVSPELIPIMVVIPASIASDHLGIVATLLNK